MQCDRIKDYTLGYFGQTFAAVAEPLVLMILSKTPALKRWWHESKLIERHHGSKAGYFGEAPAFQPSKTIAQLVVCLSPIRVLLGSVLTHCHINITQPRASV